MFGARFARERAICRINIFLLSFFSKGPSRSPRVIGPSGGMCVYSAWDWSRRGAN